jgi:hypothetical protein
MLVIVCALPVAGCKKNSQHQLALPSQVSSAPTEAQQQDCLDAARKAMGAEALVVRCGDLNTPGVQEVVAVLPAKYPPSRETGMTIWKMVILRHEPTGWRTALTASREIQNEAGYVGVEYIDDYFDFMGYQLRLLDERSGHKKAFDVSLVYIERSDGGSDQIPVEIAWNPAAGRYQEWAYDREPEGFRPEIRNPPHWKPGVRLPPTLSH